MTSLSLVHIIDVVTGKHHSIRPSGVRAMTADEIDKYNDTVPEGSPTPSEISERAAQVRSTWSKEVQNDRKTTIHTLNSFLVRLK